jgi:photosystem II stability/assembly factor-like uncharacterized protein
MSRIPRRSEDPAIRATIVFNPGARMSTKPFLVFALLLATTAVSEAAGKKEEPGEADLIRERIRLYLRRHGDDGKIDPERRLKAVAGEYAIRRAEEARLRAARLEGCPRDSSGGPCGPPSPLGIPGNNWISLGPTNGAGRVTAIAPHPSLPGTVYAGAAGGGVWKTSDGGSSWIPLTDGLNDVSVGALAVAPSSPNILYLGTGEGGYAIDFIPGIGMLTSNDGGANWSLPPSVVATTFYRISVHPTNPQELVAGTNQGGLRTTNGGTSWTNVIPRSFYGDVADVVRHPTDPKTLWAATWCVNTCSAGIGKVLKSADGGATWAEKSFGLPSAGGQAGADFRFNERLALAISPSNPLVLYASTGITDTFGSITSHIYKSTNGGESWTDLPAVFTASNTRISRYLAAQSWYNNAIIVSPSDPNTVIAGGTRYVRSTDGGTTFSNPPFLGSTVHVDAHDLRYQGTSLYIGNDGGVWLSPDDGNTAVDRNAGLVVRQFYALAVDPVHHNRILAGSQDNGTNQRTDAGGTLWRGVIGSDGFECGVNPLAPDIAYGSTQFGGIERTKAAGASGSPGFSGIEPPFSAGESGPFLSVLTIHPTIPTTIYTGSFRVWRSDNAGDTWLPLPTTTADGSSWPSTTNVTAIAVSRSNPSVLMVSKTRLVFRSIDGGKTWVNASSGLPNSLVNNVEIDPVNPSVAYASIATTIGPGVFATVDAGVSWSARSGGLPRFAAQVVRVDPTDPSTLYCGTDVGVYRTTDQGATWARFGSGLPASSVHDIRIFEDGSALRVATHGRGVWELDVPAAGNTPPVAAISNPIGPITVARGSTVAFSGSVFDPDPGDAAEGFWTFPDGWEITPADGGTPTISHTFRRAGVFPVSLAARDSHGAISSASVTVKVQEADDDCATPVVLPGGGPFPYTVIVNSESASSQPSDLLAPSFCALFPDSPSLWFEFTPPAADTYEFSTCGGAVDTVISIFTGPACGPYALADCNDDAPSDSLCDGTSSSLVSVFVAAQQTVRIQVTGFFATDVGTLPLTVRPRSTPDSIPAATGLSRYSGSTAGGTAVAIYGFGFASDMTVTFGGISATDINVLDPRYLTATAPAHAAGTVDIVVSRPAGSGRLAGAFTYVVPPGVVPCVASASALCANGGRFKVQVAWRVPSQGTSGSGNAVPITGDTGAFWFFTDNNLELVVKVVDGRAFNNKFWVFYGALSDVEYTITVTDTDSGAVKTYFNPSGTLASIADTAAF